MRSSILIVARMPGSSFIPRDGSFPSFDAAFSSSILGVAAEKDSQVRARRTGMSDASSSRRSLFAVVGERDVKSWRSPRIPESDIPTYRYVANCCINSRLYEPTSIRLTTASQTLTAINAGYEDVAHGTVRRY